MVASKHKKYINKYNTTKRKKPEYFFSGDYSRLGPVLFRSVKEEPMRLLERDFFYKTGCNTCRQANSIKVLKE